MEVWTIEEARHDEEPPHPGALLREDVLVSLGLSVTEASERLGISRVALSRVLNERAAISPSLAIRLERAGAGTARFWAALQSNQDLARVMARDRAPVKALARASTADPEH
ncbi:MAG: HigA family addiction module antitoxin [Pseudomonadota bacterium]